MGMAQMLVNVNLVALTKIGPELVVAGPAFHEYLATTLLGSRFES